MRTLAWHERARAEETLGNKRPLTRWVSQGHMPADNTTANAGGNTKKTKQILKIELKS